MGRFLPVLTLGIALLALPVHPEGDPPPPVTGAPDAERTGEKPAAEGEAAPGAKTPAERAREFRTQLLAGVELSADQTRRVDEIEREYVERQTQRLAEMDALHDQMRQARRDGDGERVLEYAKKLREAREADGGSYNEWINEVRLILDFEQQRQFDGNRERIRQESWRRKP